MLVAGQRLPDFRDRARWVSLAGMALIGSLLPFFLITSAQESVDSSLAALYAAVSPVFVAIGATLLFPEERMTTGVAAGVGLGLAGVLVLFGPDAVSGLGSASMAAQAGLLLAALLYGSSTLIARSAPAMHPITFAAGFTTISAVLSWPLALSVDPAGVEAGWQNWASVIALGLGPSGIAQILFMFVVARAGATFLSLTGYSIPVVSAVSGWIVFRETPGWNMLLAFGLIFAGVWLARRSRS
jgi:drug/metabolite transporter (DMT)-like permease